MPKSLTPNERERLKQHAETLQLWERAKGHHCGPQTDAGKRRSAMRSLKHGLASEGGIAMARWLADLNRLVRRVKRA